MDRIWKANDLARDLGYDGATPAFWKLCEDKGLKSIHGKPFAFDARYVSHGGYEVSLNLYPRGRIWHYSGTIDGQRLRGSTKTSDKEKAKRVAAEAEHLAWQRRFDGPGAGLTMAQVFMA